MSFMNKNLTPLQRRSLQQMAVAMLLTVLTNLSTMNPPNPLLNVFPSIARFTAHGGHSRALVVGLLSAIAVLPVLLAVWVVGWYLKAEPDEFIRALLVRALLWGFAVTLAATAIAGVFMNIYLRPFPLAVLNADVFFISTGIAFRLVLRSYR